MESFNEQGALASAIAGKVWEWQDDKPERP
jgi:hypothetical protein